MRILQINPYPPQHLGGSEIFCRNLAINLANKGHLSTDILTSDIFRQNQNQHYLNGKIKVIYKKFIHNLWGVNPLVNIVPFLKNNYKKYDLIHTHSYIFFTSFQVALLRKLRKFPFILHLHGGIETPSSLAYNRQERLQLIFKNLIFDKTIGRFTVKNADAIISVSQHDLKLIKEMYNVPDEKCYYIPNGVNIEDFQRRNHSVRQYITFIGRLTYIKGFDIFLDLIRKIHKIDDEIKFLVIGDGPLVKELLEVKKKIPITYYPNYPYAEMERVYNMSKVLMITSRFEGLPTTILESLACETPVITSNVGGVSELIESNNNGFFVNFNRFDNSVEKILDIVNDSNKLKKMGEKGREIIKNNYSWDIITDKIIKIYKKII
jgi:glycosyltransferase involved in cell wall biosynthesis